MSETLLRVQTLRKVFTGHGGDALVAVNDVSFEVRHGESVAIVGESGSGKTTAARIVAGLETATDGQVLLDG